jgi:hypothetical protein
MGSAPWSEYLFSIFGNCNTYFGTTVEVLNFSAMYDGFQVQLLRRKKYCGCKEKQTFIL